MASIITRQGQREMERLLKKFESDLHVYGFAAVEIQRAPPSLRRIPPSAYTRTGPSRPATPAEMQTNRRPQATRPAR